MRNGIFTISTPNHTPYVTSVFDFLFPLRQFLFSEYGSRQKAMNFDEEKHNKYVKADVLHIYKFTVSL